VSQVQLLDAATTTSAAPTLVTQGFSFKQRSANSPGGIGETDAAIIQVGAAGTGALSMTLRLWLWSDIAQMWMPPGTNATDPLLRGVLNQGTAITGTTRNPHYEIVQGLSGAIRGYLQIQALSGTSNTISAWLVNRGVHA
jgi:hypothetical protein